MAVLQNIRNKAGLLIGVIAVALLLFLVGDFLKNGSMRGSNRSIAEVNGEDVDIEEYQNRINELTEVYKQNTGKAALDQQTTEEIQNRSWEALVRDHILQTEYDATGVAVTSDEIFDMVQGDNIHPMIRQLFANPETGKVDKSQILYFLKSFDMEGGAERKAYWLYIEKELKRQRLNEKYISLINKGIIVNNDEANYIADGIKTNKSIDFFSVPYSTVSDSTITVTASEINAYYKENIEKYKQKESRNIKYVSFPIEPSAEDKQEVKKWSEDVAKELAEVNDEKELVRYVKFNSDQHWNQIYQSKDQIEDKLQEFAFGEEVGAIYGPFKENSSYKVIKLADRQMRSDSVMASHILINEKSADRTEELADSLVEVLKANKSKMADLAKQFSLDKGSAENGGDLGWFKDGMMVPTFNEAAFEGKVGEVQKIKTQYGTHILIVTKKSTPVEKAMLATVSRKIEASNTTYRNVYSQASKFRANCQTPEALAAAAKEAGYRIRSANNITKDNKDVMGLESAKSVVRWVYKAELNDVSDILELDNMFIIASLDKVAAKGYRPEKEVERLITSELKKEKKGKIIADKINSNKANSKTITSLADKMGATVKTASDINFNSFSIQGAGADPTLVGNIASSKSGEISDPIIGRRGVYVIKVTNEDANASAQSAEATKAYIVQNKNYTNSYQAYSALLDLADIVDNRLMYY